MGGCVLNTLLVNVGTVVGSAGRELVATFFYDNGVLNADDVDDPRAAGSPS